jgi:TolA-binding protein
MRSARRCLPAAVVLPLLLAAQAAPPTSELKPPAPLDQSQFELADQIWKTSTPEAAAAALEDFLKEHPQSAHAPEARYRLAAAQVLMGKAAEAKATFEKLVEDHFASPWAQLALMTHFEEDALGKLADARRVEARDKKDAERARTAVKLYELYARRFPKGSKSKEELAYKTGDCLLVARDQEGFRTSLRQAQELDKDGGWGKLAAIRLAGVAAFAQNMDQLVRLSVGDGEQKSVFLSLADEAVASLQGEDRIKCLSYQAHCLPTAQKDQRHALLRQVLKDYPASPWAAEAAYWLAEDAFADKAFARAKADYRELAAHYPQSPRAALATRWAGWIEEQDATCTRLTKVLEGVLRRLAQAKGGFAFHLQTAGDGSKNVDVNFAWQNATQDALFRLRLADAEVLLANNKEALWYRPFGHPGCLKAPRIQLPSPRFALQEDPAANRVNFNFGISTDAPADGGSPFQVSPQTAGLLVNCLHPTFHIHFDPPATAGQAPRVLRLELAVDSWDSHKPAEITVELDADDQPVAVRGTFWRDDQHKTTATIGGLVLGGPLPQSAFTVSLPPGTDVRGVEAINMFDLFSDGMRLLALLTKQVKDELKKP